MRVKPLIPGLLVALLATAAAQAEGDVDAGKLHFKKCAFCHAAEPGQNKIGPSLFGIVGRKSASGACRSAMTSSMTVLSGSNSSTPSRWS